MANSLREKVIIPLRQISNQFMEKWGELKHTIVSDPREFPFI